MTEGKSTGRNPLKIGFDIFSYVAAVATLMNFADELVKWKNSLLRVLDNYNYFIQLPFEWIGWSISPYLLNYLVFGSLCGGAMIRAQGFGEKKGYLNNHGYPKGVRFFYFILYLLFWPLGLIIAFKQAFWGYEDTNEVEIKRHLLNWLGIIIIGFLIILSFNYTIA